MMYSIVEAQNPWWIDSTRRGAPDRPRRRHLHSVICTQLRRTDRRTSVIVGARQVGKTTLLRQCVDEFLDEGAVPAANLIYFDFSDDRLIGDPPTLSDVLARAPEGLDRQRPQIVLFDEVGRARRWADGLKRLVDENTAGRLRIAVTDSAAVMLRGSRRESGLGRWDEYRLEGLSYTEFLELQARPDESNEAVEERFPPPPLDRYLERGGYPEHILDPSLPEVRRRLREDIASRAIYRDLAQRAASAKAGRTVDLERVRELFVYLMENSGMILDIGALARPLTRAGATPDRRSVESWLRLLEDAMMVVRLDPWRRSPRGRLGGRDRPKLYAADHGLVMAYATTPDPMQDPEVRGRALEALVFRHLREAASKLDARLHYYRDGGDEVDFVLGGARPVLVEVKSGAARSDALQRLERIADTTGARRALLVHGGTEVRVDKDVHVVAARSFVRDPERWLGQEER